MLPNEVFALECLARYAREGLDVKEGGVHDSYPDQFAHCPYPRPKGQKNRRAGDLGYWLTFYDHQHQGLLQSVDEGRRCYFTADVLLYLNTWPSGFFELYDIYDRFNRIPDEQRQAQSERMIGKNVGKPRTEEEKKRLSEANSGRFMGALNHRSKAIVAIKPDGTILNYGSLSEAVRDLKINQSNLSNRFLKDGHVITRGPFKGYQFFYAVKE